jgi:hypothetical protein
VHDENHTAYLPLLRLLSAEGLSLKTPEELLSSSTALIQAHSLLPELSTFHLALALHTTVPRIEAGYSWYKSNVDEKSLDVDGCDSWVEWDGMGYCDVENLKKAMGVSAREGLHHVLVFPPVTMPLSAHKQDHLHLHFSRLTGSLGRKAGSRPSFTSISPRPIRPLRH